jgi:hypothetical protein
MPSCNRCKTLKYECIYSRKTAELKIWPLLAAVPKAILQEHRGLHLVSQPANVKLEPLEVLYFDHFRFIVIPQLAFESDSPAEFWRRTILRESVRDQSVMHAILAISALSQARVCKQSGIPLSTSHSLEADRSSSHYYEAIRYYTKALGSFWASVAGPQSRNSSRKILITTMLITVFELFQGNAIPVDKVTATCIRILSGSLLRTNDLQYTSQLAGKLDDDGVDDAELWLTRRVALGAVSSPLYPQGKESILLLAQPFIFGPWPPDIDEEASAYFKTWCTFFNLSIFWHVRAQRVMETRLRDNAFEILAKEQSQLIDRSAAWESITEKRLSRSRHPMELLGNRTILPGAKIIGYCSRCFLDETCAVWEAHLATWESIKALCELILAYLNLYPTESIALRDCISFGILQIARNCRSAAIRSSAIDLCRSSLVPQSSYDMKTFVMGTSVIVSVEGAYSNENGLIPSTAKHNWISALWNAEHTELHVTLSPSVAVDCESNQMHFIVHAEDWDIAIDP